MSPQLLGTATVLTLLGPCFGCSLFNPASFNGPQLPGPAAPGEADRWWAELQSCRAAQLINYTGAAFERPESRWTQTAFAIPMVQGYDRLLWDERAQQYTPGRFLEDARRRFGGVDAIFLWPTYTNIGLDNRNQLDLFRAMPGGLVGLRALAEQFRAAGVHVMWGYNPWDTGTEREDGWVSVNASDPTDVTSTAGEGGADGFNMDTMTSTPRAFWQASERGNWHMAFQPEGGGTVGSMDWETMSTCHCTYTPMAQTVDHYKLLESRRMTSVRDRWSLDHTDAFHFSFFNGVGYEVTENDWGTTNQLTRYNAEALRRVNTVLRYFGSVGLLRSPRWRPHVTGISGATAVFGSSFPSPTQPTERLWLFVNRDKEHKADAWFDFPEAVPQMVGRGNPKTVLWDCWLGQAARHNQTSVQLGLEAHGYGCLLLSSNSSSDGPLAEFLALMRELAASGPLMSFDKEFYPLQQVMTRIPRTAGITTIPPGMVAIPGAGPDGFYWSVRSTKNQENDRLSADVQYWWEDKGWVEHGSSIPVEPFLMDRHPVTCAQWQDYINKSGYTPADLHNYLKNWHWDHDSPSLPHLIAHTPVVYVSLAEARGYCKALGKRLPHDWEWQWAGQSDRSGVSTGASFPWGANCSSNRPCMPAVMIGNELPGAPNVGSFSPQGDSPNGVADMPGSVWQFTDEFTDMRSRAALVRGGSNWQAGVQGVAGSHWYFRGVPAPLTQHNKYELMSDSYERAGTLGFRCVADLPPKTCKNSICGRWSGPPIFNTTLGLDSETVEWARWMLAPDSKLVHVSSASTDARIGSPAPACGSRGSMSAARTSLASFGWVHGFVQGTLTKDVTNTTESLAATCGFQLNVTSGVGVETLALFAGVEKAELGHVTVSASAGGSILFESTLKTIKPPLHGHGAGADALYHLTWSFATQTMVTIRWVPNETRLEKAGVLLYAAELRKGGPPPLYGY